jgi:hypothetical protein
MTTVDEGTHPSGWRTLVLRNEHLEVVVLPGKGSEIYALRSRRHDLDLLWKAPWGLRPPPVAAAAATDSAAWLDHYGGGWQELFPNGGDSCAYAGAPHTFHGEASVVPWACEVDRSVSGGPVIRLELRCARSPFRIEKRLSLEAQRPVLRIWERITNEGAVPMPFMWGHHPAFGAPFLEEGCRLDLPAAAFEADGAPGSPAAPASWLAPGIRSSWPHVARAGGETAAGARVDLSRVPGPEARAANLGYAVELQDGWYALTNPRLGLGFGLVWPREIFSCVWLWQEFCGSQGYPWYGRVYVMGVEPHTSYPGHGLVQALERGTARWLAPGEQLEMTLLGVVYEGRGNVQRITPAGEVVLASTTGSDTR